MQASVSDMAASCQTWYYADRSKSYFISSRPRRIMWNSPQRAHFSNWMIMRQTRRTDNGFSFYFPVSRKKSALLFLTGKVYVLGQTWSSWQRHRAVGEQLFANVTTIFKMTNAVIKHDLSWANEMSLSRFLIRPFCPSRLPRDPREWKD